MECNFKAYIRSRIQMVKNYLITMKYIHLIRKNLLSKLLHSQIGLNFFKTLDSLKKDMHIFLAPSL